MSIKPMPICFFILLLLANIFVALTVQAESIINEITITSTTGESFDNTKLVNLLSIKQNNTIPNNTLIESQAIQIENYLHSEGYLKAKVITKINEIKQNKIDISFIVKRDNPCLIADFVARKTKIRLFKNISSGDLCNKISISNKMREEEVKIRNFGYATARLKFKPETDLVPTKDLERATLYYDFEPGPLWNLSIINKDTGASIEEDFMSSTAFTLGDLAYISLEELKGRISNYFRTQGYADVEVATAVVEQLAAQQKQLVFEVTLGKRIFIDPNNIEFIPNLPIDKSNVLSELGLTPSLLQLSNGIPFVEENIEKNRIQLQSMLINNGFIDAIVSPPKITRNGKVQIQFYFEAGKQYFINKVVIQGAPKNFIANKNIIANHLPFDKPLQGENIKKVEALLQNDLSNQGFRLALVQSPLLMCDTDAKLQPIASKNSIFNLPLYLQCTKQEAKILVTIVLKIDAGPLFKIGKITTNEIPFYKGSRVLKISGLKSGDVLSAPYLAEARDYILRHGLFENIVFQGSDQLTLSEAERTQQMVFRDINIIATPPRAWNLRLNPLWNSERGYGFRSDFQRNNLTSDGMQFFLQGNLTQDYHQNTASSTPSTGQLPSVSLSTGIREAFFRAGNWVSPLDFNIITLGQELEVREERRWTSRVQSDIVWRPSILGIEFSNKFELSYAFSGYLLGSVTNPIRVVDSSNQVGITEISINSAVDTRDNPIWPRHGTFTSASASHSGKEFLSDLAFNKYSIDTELFASSLQNISHSISVGAKKLTSINSPGGRREKISNAEIRGFPATDSTLGPILWYAEQDLQGNCVAKISQVATTNTFSSKIETRLRTPQSSVGWVVFFDTASSYLTGSELNKINNTLQQLPTSLTSKCPTNIAKIINNNNIDLKIKESFFKKYWNDSYMSAGVGFRYFMFDVFAVHFDWGVPIQDPTDNQKNCSLYSTPYLTKGNANGPPTPPQCVRGDPLFSHNWSSPGGIYKNSLDFLKRVHISIEGKF